MPARHFPKGKPAHEAEAKGIRALVTGLPDTYAVYSNIELPTGQRGQTYEHDAVVLAPHGLFTVELKSWGGTITGNRDRWTLADGAFVQSPLPLILAKARSLKGRLLAIRRDLSDVWVQALVFLTPGDAVPHITPDFAGLVCAQRDIIPTLTKATAFGQVRALTPNQLGAVHKFLHDGAPSRAPEQLNGFRLHQRLAAEDRPYQAWLATREGDTRVLHIHTVTGEDAAERERSKNHALREATLHEKLRGGPDVLGYRDYFEVHEDPHRVVLMFDDTTPLVPADVWVRDRAPGLAARLKASIRIARAVGWVHGRGLVHRRLCPEAALVTGTSAEPPAEVRLTGFDLARDLATMSPTTTGSSLGDPSFRCSAPEALKTGEATARSDLFSLGALLYELLAGRPLFATPDAVLRPFTLAPFDVGGRPVPDAVFRVVGSLLAVDPAHRPGSADEAADALDAAYESLTKIPRKIEWEAGREVRNLYQLKHRLGRGATATTWLATHLQAGGDLVLKIADAGHAALLREEYRIGQVVQHPNLVRTLSIEPEGEQIVLVLAHVDGVTATLWAGAGDDLNPDRFLLAARGLFGALHALHEGGFLHRDVKPDNVMMKEPSGATTLVDLGLAAPEGNDRGLAVGTVQYKDPLLYAEGKWTRANDQYAAFLVLYEVLTGAHPFGSAAPDSGHAPVIEPELFPDSFSPAAIKALAGLFSAALSPVRELRPKGIPEALSALERTLGTARPARKAQVVVPLLADATMPTDSISALAFSPRAQGTLSRLAILRVGELASLDAALMARLPNVGGKTTRELLACAQAVRARWPALPTDAPAALERFYPPLANDERLLQSVELGLNQGNRAAFAERGIRTVGDLARMPVLSLGGLPNFPRERQEICRGHMVRLAGRDAGYDSLDALDEALKVELGDKAFAAISVVFGLAEGTARAVPEAAVALGMNEQRIQPLIETDDLRKPGSVGRQLAVLVDELLPAVGFAHLRELGHSLSNRLPVRANARISALGYARLAGVLLHDDLSATDAVDLRVVVRMPWTQSAVAQAASRLQAAMTWPPRSRRSAELDLWDGIGDEVQRALVRGGADAAGLLESLLPLAPGILIDGFGSLYTPPIALAPALAQLRPVGSAQATADELLDEVCARWEGISTDGDLDVALATAGYRQDGERWVDPDRISLAAVPVAPVVDATVPRQRAGPNALIVSALAAQASQGGVRVVVMHPGEAHETSRRLVEWIGAELGRERVQFVDIDRVLIDALKSADLWKFVPGFEANPGADWSWVASEIRPALEQVAKNAVPGVVTVLARPALLGTLGLMDWLGGFYDRARGGRHGLVVLAIPGGIHDGRVRLNERYNLACTPDMAAVFLDGDHP